MAPRAGVPRISSVNKLDWQTVARGSFESQRLSGAVANPRAFGIRAIDPVFG